MYEVYEAVDGEEKDTSCSPESLGRRGRRWLARLDGVVGQLLLRLLVRTGSWSFNGDRRL
jgi:hypothetical protein